MLSKPKPESLSSLIKAADSVFSEYVRRSSIRDGYIKCFICDCRLTFSQACCGHWIRRDQMPLRYDLINGNAICYPCNERDERDPSPYEEAMLRRYTHELLETLKIRAKGLQKYSRFEVEEIISEYKQKLNQLK